MKLKTLNYIHQLLIENEAKTCKAKEITREALIRAEEEEAANCESLQKSYDNMRMAYNEALEARMDFEEQDW